MYREREIDSRQQLIGTSTDELGNVVDSNTLMQGSITQTADVVGNFPNANAFESVIRSRYQPLINGTRTNTVTNLVDRYFNERPLDVSTWNPVDPDEYLPPPTFVDLDALAWKVLAESNPSEPHVSVPQAIGELKDLPGLVRDWGRGIINAMPKLGKIQHFGRSHLTVEWAIKPLIGDLWKLYNFSKASKERLDELRNLRDGKAIKKRVSLGHDLHEHTQGNLLNSSQIWVTATLNVYATYEMWGSCQWVLPPDTFIQKMSERELELFARRIAGGFNIHGGLAAFWELVPWSWLADWFAGIGDMISATNNSIPLTYRNVCIMRKSLCRVTADIDPVAPNYNVTFTPQFRMEVSRKKRWPWAPVIPFPIPRIPVINGRKWSILASLAALRVPTRRM